MYRAGDAAEIDRFLDPEYWGGQMAGRPTMKTLPTTRRLTSLESQLFGYDKLLVPLAKLASGQPRPSAEAIYINGEDFSPDNHEPGSTVFYRKEVLVHDPGKPTEQSHEKPLPFGLVAGRAAFTPEDGCSTRLAKPPYIYYSGDRVGQIIKSRASQPNRLVYLSLMRYIAINKGRKKGKGCAVLFGNIEPTPLGVGVTRRYITKSGADLLIRVNSLYVCHET